MSDSVHAKMARGAVWMVLFKFVERGLGLISTLILARLLTPADFGVVAMAVAFISMAELLGAFGFDVAIIHNQRATDAEYNSAWTCNILLGACIALIMVVAAVPISHFYRRPELVAVVLALALGPLIAAAQNIGVVAFRKELDFRREFRFQVGRKIAGFMVVVPLAVILRNYWALVAGMLFSQVAGTTLSYLMHPYRPRPTLSKFRQLFHFSRWMLLNNVVLFARDRSSDFFLGRLGGPSDLGTYNVAYELANLPTSEISAPINRALLPGFAKMQSNDSVAQAYRGAVQLLAMLALPASALLFGLAPYLVVLLLGPKWTSAIPVMKVLAFNGALMLFHSSISSILFGRGFPARVMLTNALHVVLLVVSMTVALVELEAGPRGAAFAALGTALLSTPIYIYQLRRCLGISPQLFFGAIARPLMGCVAAILVLELVLPEFEVTMGALHMVALLAFGLLTGLTVMLGVIGAAWSLAGRPDGAERLIIDWIRAQWSRHNARRLSSADG